MHSEIIHWASPASLHSWCPYFLALATRLKAGGTSSYCGGWGGCDPRNVSTSYATIKLLPTVWQAGRKYLGEGAQIFFKMQTFYRSLTLLSKPGNAFTFVLCNSFNCMTWCLARRDSLCFAKLQSQETLNETAELASCRVTVYYRVLWMKWVCISVLWGFINSPRIYSSQPASPPPPSTLDNSFSWEDGLENVSHNKSQQHHIQQQISSEEQQIFQNGKEVILSGALASLGDKPHWHARVWNSLFQQSNFGLLLALSPFCLNLWEIYVFVQSTSAPTSCPASLPDDLRALLPLGSNVSPLRGHIIKSGVWIPTLLQELCDCRQVT